MCPMRNVILIDLLSITLSVSMLGAFQDGLAKRAPEAPSSMPAPVDDLANAARRVADSEVAFRTHGTLTFILRPKNESESTQPAHGSGDSNVVGTAKVTVFGNRKGKCRSDLVMHAGPTERASISALIDTENVTVVFRAPESPPRTMTASAKDLSALDKLTNGGLMFTYDPVGLLDVLVAGSDWSHTETRPWGDRSAHVAIGVLKRTTPALPTLKGPIELAFDSKSKRVIGMRLDDEKLPIRVMVTWSTESVPEPFTEVALQLD